MSVPVVPPESREAARVPRSAEAFRSLAGALAHVADFDGFVRAVEAALNQAGLFERAQIDLHPPPGPERPPEFAPSQLHVPLVHEGRLAGLMRLSGRAGQRPFAAADLHLMSALSTFVASLVGHALRHADAVRATEALRFLIDLAPVGLAALAPDGRVLAANRRARLWLGGDEGAPFDRLAAPLAVFRAGGAPPRGPRPLELPGRVVWAEAAAAAAGDDGPAAIAVALQDLGPEEARWRDGLEREVFRCGLLARPLTLLVLESATSPGRLFQALPALAGQLGPEDVAGPCGGPRIGLVLSGSGEHDAVGLLRRARGVLGGVDDLRLGTAVLGQPVGEPGALVAAATEGLAPLAGALRPRLLVHDDYPGVTAMLERVLRNDFQVVRTGRVEHALGELRRRAFDGLVTELDLQESWSGLDLAHQARTLQPGLRTFFTAGAARARRVEDDPLLRESPVFPKPFDVAEVQVTLRSALVA